MRHFSDLRAHARGTLSGILALALCGCGGKVDNQSGGTGGSSGIASAASGGSSGGIVFVPSGDASGGGGPGFIGIPPVPPIEAGLPDCWARVLLVYGGDAAECAWKIPELPRGQTFEPNRVNIQTEMNAEPTSLYHVRSASECGNTTNTWFYDDETSPTFLALCPRACEQYLSAPGARLYFVLGCANGSRLPLPPSH